GLRVVEVALAHRHLVVPHAAHVIGHTDRHLVETGEDVELGDHEVGDAVDPGGVAPDHRVHPAAAAGAAGRGAVLGPGLAQELAHVVIQLGRERAFADACGVGLEDGHDPVDAGRRNPGPGAGAARGGVG